MTTPLLSVRDLHTTFPVRSPLLRRKTGEIQAVSGVSFDLEPGQTLGLVGESGSGKSTLARTIMGLEKPASGEIIFDGTDLTTASPATMRSLRRQVQMIFQDPQASLNPRRTVHQIVSEAWEIHREMVPRSDWRREAQDLLARVGLNPDHADRYPHQFSGGQRQRIAIARALAVNPRLIVLDEPVSALDVSIQAGVINLLEDLQAQLGVAVLFVAHDLSVIRHISSRIAVMYLGQVVESGDTEAVFTSPRHPYTQALLSAVPLPDPQLERGRKRVVLEGDLPSPVEEIPGCRFASRCPVRATLPADDQRRCDTVLPVLTGDDDQLTACHFPLTPASAGTTDVRETTRA